MKKERINASLTVLAQAGMEMQRQPDGSFTINGKLEAHHSSFVGTQKGQTLELSGQLLVPRSDGQGVEIELRLGDIAIKGVLNLNGLTVEQTLFLLGRAMFATTLDRQAS